MKLRVYVESSVVSYLTAKPSRDLIVAGQQALTQAWWSEGAHTHALCFSSVVMEEISRGDSEAASARQRVLDGLDEVSLTEAAVELAARLLDAGALPAKAMIDALHVAVCAVNGVDVLVTWNCKHIANVTMFEVIDQVCRDAGYAPPRLCTPAELWGN